MSSNPFGIGRPTLLIVRTRFISCPSHFFLYYRPLTCLLIIKLNFLIKLFLSLSWDWLCCVWRNTYHNPPLCCCSGFALSTLCNPLPVAPLQEVGTRDSYFSRFDPHEEHDAYRKAEQRLEERHREKVSKVRLGATQDFGCSMRTSYIYST